MSELLSAQPRGILLDIEGTTSSIHFVYDVMFPYVREHLTDFLAQSWESDALQNTLPLLAADRDTTVSAWLAGHSIDEQQRQVRLAVFEWMDADRKLTGLKQLQGLIWKSGFESGQIVAHLYPDVAPAITRWQDSGLDIRIYSSGSIASQKLFFGHSVDGNLLGCFSGHYDTTVGSKRESSSYRKIVADWNLPAAEILFVSDVPEELLAARDAGLQTALSVRPGNHAVGFSHGFRAIHSFSELLND